MSNDTAQPLSDEEVVALARQAIEQSRDDIGQRTVAETRAAGRDLQQQQPGITIDLGYKGITRLPEEVIDIIRTKIERLALPHNSLTSLPLRLTECSRLRYLNVRHNLMREIPPAVLRITTLEILDVRVNKIKTIPKEIANLTSLKVLAIQNNQIEELPTCIGDISSLLVLKIDGNPLTFPPPEVCTIRDNTPAPANENERDAVIATQVKKFMRQHAEKLRSESEGDESESNVETPRPSRRMVSGRFPVKPSISNLDGFENGKPESPGIAPPIPTRSHYRVKSQQNNLAVRRPPVSPLVLTNGNERNRSQSEGAGSASNRAKRMGIYTKQTSELGSVDELRRTSHFRGFSQGYVVSGNNTSNGMSGPATAVGYGDTGTLRSIAQRPLSDVHEHKRRSRAPDVVVEAGKNFVYAISQLHDTVSHMMQTIKRSDRNKEGLKKKEGFPRKFSHVYLQIRTLNELLRKFDTLAEEDEEDAIKLSQAIYQSSLRCLGHFMQINMFIAQNATEISQNGDPKYLRSFLLLQQGSLIELRNACSVMGAEFAGMTTSRRRVQNGAESISSLQPPRPLKVRRYQTSPPQRIGQYQIPPPVMLNSADTSRTNTLTSISAATPRSGESFSTLASTMSRTNTMQSSFDDADEDTQFDRIYSKLRSACDYCRDNMPQISSRLKNTYEVLKRELDSENLKIKVLAALIGKADHVERMTYPLAKRLSQMQLKDPYARSQSDFWQQCMGFVKAWSDLAMTSTNDGRNLGLLSSEVKQLMKPLHKVVKEASLAIHDSPWSHLTSVNPGAMGPPSSLPSLTSRIQHPRFPTSKSTMSSSGGPGFPTPLNTSISSVASQFSSQPHSSQSSVGSGSVGYVTPVPATPLSAALGPAAQATVPNTPNQIPSANSGGADRLMGSTNNTGPFAGNVFERADRLLSMTARRV